MTDEKATPDNIIARVNELQDELDTIDGGSLYMPYDRHLAEFIAEHSTMKRTQSEEFGIALIRLKWALRRYHPMVRWPWKLAKWLSKKL